MSVLKSTYGKLSAACALVALAVPIIVVFLNTHKVLSTYWVTLPLGVVGIFMGGKCAVGRGRTGLTAVNMVIGLLAPFIAIGCHFMAGLLLMGTAP